MSVLYHFKMSYDPYMDYPSVAKQLFGENKCLVTAEKLDINDHVHFQGMSDHTDSYFDKMLTEATKGHYKRAIRPDLKASRPVKRVRTTVTEAGFQYICKESPVNVLYKCQFTDEDIQALHDASDAHVAQIKDGLRNHLIADPTLKHLIDTTFDYGRIHKEANFLAFMYYRNKKTMPPPNVRKLVIWALMDHEPINRSFVDYFMELM